MFFNFFFRIIAFFNLRFYNLKSFRNKKLFCNLYKGIIQFTFRSVRIGQMRIDYQYLIFFHFVNCFYGCSQ